jgi:aspartate carbamoyltransferase catalytic subunit
MPDYILKFIQERAIEVCQTSDLDEVIGDSDVIYWTRVQEERFANRADYETIKDGFIMTQPVLNRARSDAILLHPLPRKHEMGTPDDHDQLDADPRSFYFQQMENGMFMRMALLAKVLGGRWV